MPVAEGQQLDNLGEIVGETRQGRSDEDYLIAIRAKIKLNISSGTIEDVLAVAALVEDGFTYVTEELFPAAFEITIQEDVTDSADVDRVAVFIASARGAGIDGVLRFGFSPGFTYDGAAGTGYDEGRWAGAKKV